MSTIHAPHPDHPTAQPPAAGPANRGRRVIGLVLSGAALTASAAMAATAIGVHHLDAEHREGGYLTGDPTTLTSAGFAVTVEEIDLDGLSGDWLLGTARLRATDVDGQPVFVGVAPADDVADYVEDFEHSLAVDLDGSPTYDVEEGGAPGGRPTDVDIWAAAAAGPGTQTVTWKPEEGDWAVVVMNADASAGVQVRADVAATVPAVHRVVDGLGYASVASGAVGLLGLLALALSVRRHRAVR